MPVKAKVVGAGKDFEKNLETLEKLLQELESGKLNLEESLEKFEQGVLLYKSCREYLGVAEKKITQLKKDLKLEDFD